jgi:hypothetical protein
MSHAGDMSITNGKGGLFGSRGRGGGVGEVFGAVWVIGAPVGHARNPEGRGGAPFWAVWGRRHPFSALVGPGGVGTSFWGYLACLWALELVRVCSPAEKSRWFAMAAPELPRCRWLKSVRLPRAANNAQSRANGQPSPSR